MSHANSTVPNYQHERLQFVAKLITSTIVIAWTFLGQREHRKHFFEHGNYPNNRFASDLG